MFFFFSLIAKGQEEKSKIAIYFYKKMINMPNSDLFIFNTRLLKTASHGVNDEREWFLLN